ncbi:hypothetical protein PDE_00143 [Penicillium oxalicum 114-2]|uniref:Uncharacterized protein n=1 Tax=Penicillium oxalicum (strain 114-2 / CGMCC 5302) TaxID=933388 RepID=S7Z961_PENO1|nr:hypothetical protein PDE_00143 [Penicillium oxalicum 114-2]
MAATQKLCKPDPCIPLGEDSGSPLLTMELCAAVSLTSDMGASAFSWDNPNGLVLVDEEASWTSQPPKYTIKSTRPKGKRLKIHRLDCGSKVLTSRTQTSAASICRHGVAALDCSSLAVT